MPKKSEKKLKGKKRERGYVKELYWFPKSQVSMSAVKKNFTIEYVEDMDQEVILEMFKVKKRNGKDWIGLPRGDINRVKDCVIRDKDFERIKDRRTDAPVDFSKLKFQGTFNKGQLKAARVMARNNNGVLKSAPRTGKCLDGETLVSTSHGILRMSMVPKGPLIKDTGSERWYEPKSDIWVAGPNGPRQVTAVYESYADVYRLDTSTGHTLIATPDERVWVLGTGWVKLKDLQPGDEIQTGQVPLWRSGGRAYTDLHPEYMTKVGNSLTKRFSVLLGYRSRMRSVYELNGVEYVSLDASGSCFKYARDIVSNLAGIEHTQDDLISIPDWLWSMIQEFGSSYFVPDCVRVAHISCLSAYIKALYESTGFRDWDGSDTFKLIWTLPEELIAQQLQVILENYGIQVNRSGKRLYGDAYNSSLFVSTFEVRGIRVKPHDTIKPTSTPCKVFTVTPLGQRAVFDLSVGVDEDQHNFCANGMLVHNTIMGTEAVIRAGQKTLILAGQTDLIEQFAYETINDPTGELFNGASFKHPYAEICSTLEDFLAYDICLATYQTFISPKGQKLLSKIKDLFGTILVDEVHRAPATRFSQILCQFSARRLWGLTATDDRKDGKWPVAEMVIGPTCHRVKAKALSARVYALETGIKHKSPPKTWNGQINFLFKSVDRNKLIARTALRDVKRGHTVLIPVTQHEHADMIRKEIIKLHGNRHIVFTFTGKVPKDKRKWARALMRTDKRARIHIANRSMLTGVNVPRWSAIYTVVPITNPPLYEQEIQRIGTVMDGKPTPIVRYFYDGVLPASKRRINICSQTLMSPELGHTITDSFHALNESVAAVKRQDDFSKSASPSMKAGSAKKGFGSIVFSTPIQRKRSAPKDMVRTGVGKGKRPSWVKKVA